MNNKKELGKGIRALLENISSEEEESLQKSAPMSKKAGAIAEVPLAQIEINPFQPRAEFDKQKLSELAESIRTHGIIQPITLRRLSLQKYQLIAGERRLKAVKMVGLESIPAFIRTANDEQMLEMALIENIQREDLNAIEISITYKRLMEECRLTQDALGQKVGKERSTINNYLRLLKLPPEIQSAIKEKKLNMGHARALITLKNVDEQLMIFKEIISKSLSVRKVEELVRNIQHPKKNVKTAKVSLSPELDRIRQSLSSSLATKVNIKPKKNGQGEIIISWFTDDDLNRIIDLLEDNE